MFYINGMEGDIVLIQLIVSVLLYFVIFFGIAFILNMLLRRTWLMAILYPFVISLIVGDSSFSEYFTNTGEAFSSTFTKMISLAPVDIIILSSGLVGTIVSGFVIKFLRKSGYQMF